ncbi:MAG: galactose-1-phosphate uridylyltransferase [Epsilonproteobacteria bacterium]|nr:galactose-1-phosphate uridylyltransferase [Campylobacterota bacterium]
MSEIRYCPLRGERVIIAQNRLHRPSDFNMCKESGDDISECPFERGKEEFTPKEIFSIKNEKGEWLTRVVPNLYHALSVEERKISYREGFFEYQDGLGAHEVIIETPDHFKKMKDYSIEEFKNYLLAVQSRYIDLQNDKRLEYISIFKNSGVNAGATLKHPHSQIIATPFIPKEIDREIEIARNYYKDHKRALLDDIVNEELRLEKRVVCKNDHFIAFLPYASFFPFEIFITSLNGVCSIKALNYDRIISLSEILKEVFIKLYKVLGDFDFNMIFKNSPPITKQTDPNYFYEIDSFYRFYIQITPRLYKFAGFEIATNMHINPLSPEEASFKLKNI